MKIDDDKRALLRKVLAYVIARGAFPDAAKTRLDYAGQRALIDALASEYYLEYVRGRYALTLAGLRACDSQEARQEIAMCNALLPVLEEAYLATPGKRSVEELAKMAGRDVAEVARSLTFLTFLRNPSIVSVWEPDPNTGLVISVQLAEGILDSKPIDWR